MDLSSRTVDTHISTLVFLGDVVVKHKKPIRTDFVDFTTVGARGAACRNEVQLNRRLAPEVYLGVATVTLDRLDGSDPHVIDHAVVMRRLPEDRRLSTLLEDRDVGDEVDRLAQLIASFHASARRGPDIDDACRAPTVAALWADSVAEVDRVGVGIVDPGENRLVGRLAEAYVAGRTALFDGRVAAGRAVDGHGDLQADDVFCLPEGPQVLDCIEFADRFRFGDVLADVAFLSMDLERLGHPALATSFLGRYRELAGDSWPDSLAHLWIAYRAHIRAKVTCIRSSQLAASGDAVGAASAAADARSLHALAVGHLLDGRVRLVVVGGGPGTGKSTVARGLAERLGAVLVSSDEIRDALLPRSGDRRGDDPGRGRYAPRHIDAVYDELLARAEASVLYGESVVADASWIDPRHRDRARDLALRTSSDLVELRCECPAALAEERIVARAAVGSDPSEATVDVARSMAEAALPWPEATPLDTARPVDDVVAAALRRCTTLPSGAAMGA
ncbi:MAG: AAA family ATPase [Actinobacteria bacterium]|nr:AAA family ATPase [Actinomycetota bacterium]